jgi:uncharacterized protein (TIGR02391 family)
VIEWYLAVRNLLRTIEQKARDALELYEGQGKDATAAINGYMKSDYQRLWDVWSSRFPDEHLGNLGRHIGFGMDVDYRDIFTHDLPELEKRAEAHLLKESRSKKKEKQQPLGFEHLLHPVVMEHSYQLYRNGHLREAVLNSVTALFDYIRSRTKSKDDGDKLVGQVFSLDHPILVLSELGTESGQNDQKGFMQIFRGAYQGIRNPKAHSMTHDLTPEKAVQYLVFASLLMRRVEEAKLVKKRA